MKVLIVDDERSILDTLALHFGTDHEVDTARCIAEARERIGTGTWDLILLDLKLPDGTGLELLRSLRASGDLTPLILVTGHGDLQSAIAAMREGATDYIRKPIDIDELDAAVARVARTRASAGSDDLVLEEGPGQPGKIVGSSRAVLDLLKRVGLAAQSRVTVLLLGESGTGKELVARNIHEHSSPGEPFVAVNCSAIVPTLLESELFGHERGAFTGAQTAKAGKLEIAGPGTAFLDEIGDLPLDLQAKILRVLQEREFERVGGIERIPFRARVIAATNRPLKSMVGERTFREDLYYRLAVDPIVVPALRERPDDIPELVVHILRRLNDEFRKRIRRVAAADVERLRRYPWPGNVRELENVLTSCALATAGDTLDLGGWTARSPIGPDEEGTPRPAPRPMDPGENPSAPPATVAIGTLAQAERAQILKALEATGWNITHASMALGVSRPTLRKKIAEYGLGQER